VAPILPFEATGRSPDTQRRFAILHVVFSSRIAGSERYCIDLANRQAALGHEVHVAGRRNSPVSRALAAGVTFHGLGRWFRGWQLRRLVHRLEPDICHGHLSAACKALGRISGAHRSVATLHVGYKPHQHGRLDGVICVNRAQAGRLDGFDGTARTIPNWLPQASAVSTAPGLRAELGLAADTFLVGSVGRLHESKGADVLVAAFQAAAPANAALVLLGEGPQRAALERRCAGDPRIHLLGYRAAVQDCLRDLDLFVSPSREESFGLAILEAMGAGIPVIATAAEGPAEYLQDQPVNLVPPGEIGALTDALAEACQQFQDGQLGHLTYDLRFFDPAVRVANVMEFYGQVADTRLASGTRVWMPTTATV
jgi:glycosyltransferase involved in cell wall biosynthesis